MPTRRKPRGIWNSRPTKDLRRRGRFPLVISLTNSRNHQSRLVPPSFHWMPKEFSISRKKTTICLERQPSSVGHRSIIKQFRSQACRLKISTLVTTSIKKTGFIPRVWTSCSTWRSSRLLREQRTFKIKACCSGRLSSLTNKTALDLVLLHRSNRLLGSRSIVTSGKTWKQSERSREFSTSPTSIKASTITRTRSIKLSRNL